MDINSANMIINEARAAGIDVVEKPTIEETADEIVRMAQEAFEDGVRGEEVVKILNLASNAASLAEQAPAAEEHAEDTPQGADQGQAQDQKQSKVPPPFSYESTKLAIAKAQQRKLPIPKEPPDQPIEMPRDLTALPLTDLRKLQSDMNATYVYSIWIVACEEADLAAAQQIADYKHQSALAKVNPTGSDGKKKLAAVIEAEAEADEEVHTWRERSRNHQNNLRIYKALKDGYLSNLERISREFTMRSEGRPHER